MSATRAIDRWIDRLRGAIGLPRTHRVGPVRYRERSTEPLSRALSHKGSGSKDYEVRFASGERMLIRCTRARVYDDLVGDRTPTSIRAIETMIRPGMRVLICPGGTGALADRIAGHVGPSGAVVSLEKDAESVQFASSRYARDNIAYEIGTTSQIGGETDGAFDAAIIAFLGEDEDAASATLGEAIRLVADGGWVLARAEGRVRDEPSRAAPADARALLRHALERASPGAEGGPARVRTVRWLDEPSGTPAILLLLNSDNASPQA